jgi:hypothetical protein
VSRIRWGAVAALLVCCSPVWFAASLVSVVAVPVRSGPQCCLEATFIATCLRAVMLLAFALHADLLLAFSLLAVSLPFVLLFRCLLVDLLGNPISLPTTAILSTFALCLVLSTLVSKLICCRCGETNCWEGYAQALCVGGVRHWERVCVTELVLSITGV